MLDEVELDPERPESVMIEPGPVAEVPVPQVTRHRLVPDPQDISDLVTRITGRSGLIVAGPMTDRSGSAAVANLGAALGWPIMSDPISGLRSGGHPTTAVVGSDLLAADGGEGRQLTVNEQTGEVANLRGSPVEERTDVNGVSFRSDGRGGVGRGISHRHYQGAGANSTRRGGQPLGERWIVL